VCSLMALLSMFYLQAVRMHSRHLETESNQRWRRNEAKKLIDTDVTIATTESEPKFLSLLKTNTGVGYVNKASNRIGVLAAPGSVGEALFESLNEAMRGVDALKGKFELVLQHSAPPYGYGKNHGFDKFIRLVITPMEFSVWDAGTSLLGTNFENELNSMHVASVTRQFIRWHCRLSHVSAHTPLLTVLSTNLKNDLESEVQKIFRFVLGDDDFIRYRSILSFDISSNKAMERLSNLFVELDYKKFHSKISQQSINNAIIDELKTTNNLSGWPCLSLWNVYGASENNSFPNLLAGSLVPNCKANSSKCFVKRDICEDSGKAHCD